MAKRLTLFLRLTALELIASGIICAVISIAQNRRSLLAVSMLVIFGGGMCFWLGSRSAFLVHDAFDRFIRRFGRMIPFLPVFALSVFLLGFAPSRSLTIIISPLLFCLWIIGLQAVWVVDQAGGTQAGSGQERGGVLSFIALTLAIGILLVPSRIPSILSGVPLNQPFEFVTAVLLVPLAWIINRRFFSSRRVVIIFLILFLVKSSAFFLFSQSGLGVRVYDNASSNGEWKRSYTTWLAPEFTEVMQTPYARMREFPVEWVNERSGFDFDRFWMMMEVNGNVHSYDEGRLVILIRGARQPQFEMIVSNEEIPVMIVSDLNELSADLYQRLPTHTAFDLHGTAVYIRFGEARFEPLLLYPDGSVKSLFESAGTWISSDGVVLQNQALFLQTLLNLIAVLFIATIFMGLILGVASLYSQNKLSLADIYLVCSGVSFYYFASLVDKPQVQFFLAAVLLVVAVVKILDFKFAPSYPGFKSYILFAGVTFLASYLVLDIDSLRAIALLPEAQDGLEYQTFARNIFVEGDLLLAQTPPRAYKVLFPYVVGTLHILFGQSTAAQFFLNAWCAVLSAALTFSLAKRLQLSLQISFLASVSFLVILCLPSSYIYYFRFGLIEPVAVLCVLATLVFAMERRTRAMYLAAILTVLFRLDYLGLALVAIIFMSEPVTGGLRPAWGQLLQWVRRHGRKIAMHAVVVILPPALVITGYFFFIPNYMLNAGDTAQQSIHTLLEGFMRVLIGGSFTEFQKKIIQNSYEFFLIVIPLAAGFVISLLSIFHRRGIFAKIDLRLALLIPSILPAYIVVRPAAYFPRFSFPILALDLLLIGMFLYHLQTHNHDIKNASP